MNLDKFKQLLVRNNYKVTRQRELIFDTLINHPNNHITPEKLYDVVRSKDETIGIATIYRTLQIFETLDIIYKTDLGDDMSYYEIVNEFENHRHHHLVCTNCKKIIEVNVDQLDELEKRIEKKYNFTIKDHSLKFFGLCSECKEENKNRKG